MDGGGAEGVDGLGIVADDGQAAAVGSECLRMRGLQGVGVLVFVDEHGVEAAARCRRRRRVLHRVVPVEEQVVVVEEVLLALAMGVFAEETLELLGDIAGTRGSAF